MAHGKPTREIDANSPPQPTARDVARDATLDAPNDAPNDASGATVEAPPESALTQATLGQLLGSAPVAIVAVDDHGNVVYANNRLIELFGYTHQEMLELNLEALMPERFHSEHVAHREQFNMRPDARRMGSGMDLWARRKDGSEFPIEAGLSHLRVDGQLLTLSSIVDISRRRQNEETLERRVEERTREIEQRRRVADSLREILAILNSNRSLQEILDHITLQASHLLGAEASAIYELQDESQPLKILSAYGIDAQTLELSESVAADLPETGKLNYSTPDTNGAGPTSLDEPPSPYRAQLAVPLAAKDDVFGGLMLYYREPRRFSSEEIELAVTFGEQAKLAIENARLRAQAEQTAVTAERNRIARDLHDSVTQTLFSASLIAEVLPRLWDRNPEESRRRLEELRSLTRGALAEMRSLLLELRPAALVEVDINDLLRQLTEAAIGRARIPIALHIDGNAGVPADLKVALYHIAQEALNNVTKHARAEHASVTLERHPQRISLSVSDDGRGFEIGRITGDHLGLTIMRERAADIGAELDIRSTPGEGTNVTALWSPHDQ